MYLTDLYYNPYLFLHDTLTSLETTTSKIVTTITHQKTTTSTRKQPLNTESKTGSLCSRTLHYIDVEYTDDPTDK